MSMAKDLIVLAVTKMHGGVCTAGIDEQGNWIRPVRPALKLAREHDTVTDYCLLPLDFFHEGHSHIETLAITRFWLHAPVPSSPHIEDWTLDLHQSMQLLRKLSNEEQEAFLLTHREQDPSFLLSQKTRSLGLFQIDDFQFNFRMNAAGADIAVRADFVLSGQHYNDIGCTDLKIRALGRKWLTKHDGRACILTADDFRQRGKKTTYFALGLSRLYKDKHWLIVVGVHPVPELEVEIDYARL